MQLHCPQCGTQIRADDINLERELAKCAQCGALFSFEGAFDSGEPSSRRVPSRRTRPAVALPKGMTVDDAGPTLKLTRRWWSPTALFLVVFCTFWDGFLVFWYFIAFSQDTPVMMKVFPIVHVAVGVGLTYVTVCYLVNRTVIAVADRLTIRHGPLPWPGSRSIEAGDIAQLFCRERVDQGRNGMTVTYELNAILKNRSRVRLLRGLDDSDDALYLEQTIEQRLRIPDHRVPGELSD